MGGLREIFSNWKGRGVVDKEWDPGRNRVGREKLKGWVDGG